MRSALRPTLRLVSFCALAVLAACSSSRYYDVRYAPAPIEMQLASTSVTGSQVRVLATVTGVARASRDTGRRALVEVRLRLENLGRVDARLAQDALALVSADLVAFEPGRIRSGGDLLVPAGATETADLAFEAPNEPRVDDIDWNGLNLRFSLYFGEERVTAGATFSRVTYWPEYEPRFRVGVGFGYRYGYGRCW